MACPDLLLDVSNNYYYLHSVVNQGQAWILYFPRSDFMWSVLYLLTHFELMPYTFLNLFNGRKRNELVQSYSIIKYIYWLISGMQEPSQNDLLSIGKPLKNDGLQHSVDPSCRGNELSLVKNLQINLTPTSHQKLTGLLMSATIVQRKTK